jgi:hypothetical protein
MSRYDPVRYVTSIAKKFTNEIGFIPLQRYENAILGQELFVQELNDEPCGFLFTGKPNLGRIHIWQTAIQLDARRLAAATSMIDRLKEHARRKHVHTITLRCRDDLDANAFWKATGFVLRRISLAGKARGGTILEYSLEVATKQLSIFDTETPTSREPDQVRSICTNAIRSRKQQPDRQKWLIPNP